MQKKPNIRSIRYSDEIAELIERQAGENFSQKFENLVTRAFYELPAAEADLARVNKDLSDKRRELAKIRTKIQTLGSSAKDIEWRMKNLADAISRAEKEA